MATPPSIDRMKGEGSKAYAGFLHYAEAGPKRSVRKTAAGIGSKRGQTANWSTRWRWVARAAVYDDDMAKIRHAVTVQVVRRSAKERAQERSEFADKLREMAARLADKAAEMLRHPTAEVVKRDLYEDGREKLVVVRPAHWTFGDAARMVETVAQLTDSAMSLEDVEEGMTRERVELLFGRLMSVVMQRLPDEAARFAVLAGVRELVAEMDAQRTLPRLLNGEA